MNFDCFWNIVFQLVYNLGTDCSGNFVRLFSLAGVYNSTLYLDVGSVAPEPFVNYYDWQDVCLSSDGGNFTIFYQEEKPKKELGVFACLGSFVRDDFNGGVVGGCSMYSQKIWVSLS